MDEILASIRRIIESNDPPTGSSPQMLSDDYDDEPAEEIRLTIDDEPMAANAGFQAASEHQIPSFPMQGRFQEPEIERTPQIERNDVPPLSLADVAARVRAAADRNASALREPETAAVQPVTQQVSPAIVKPAVQISAAAVESLSFVKPKQPEIAVQTPARSEPVMQPQETAPLKSVARHPETAVRAVETAVADRSAEPVKNIYPEPSPVTRSSGAMVAGKDIEALVSPIVSQQVARSFDDLALAVDGGQRRSFDDIAEDMMRPMLQEWLDDNLPTLVERLVREEIERVARGPRR
nr:PopZ family protein [Pararhizobium sp.]